jgi:hypothetical protein
MIMGSVFECLCRKNVGRYAEMLDSRHDDTRRDSSEDRGEEYPPKHRDRPGLSVAGKADGVAGVVGSVMHIIAAAETGARQEKKPEGENEKAGELTLANSCG